MNNQKGTVYEIGTGIESETFALTLIGEGGGKSRIPQQVITATQMCFVASALLNW